MSKRVGVVLSGCGYLDGSEIHEAVITLLALDRAGADIVMMAPDKPQMHVVDHLTGMVVEGETRNVLEESARIARGKVRDIATVRADELDALALPGGYGAAKNLCDFAVKGAECALDPEVERLIVEVHQAGKPIAPMCIAPAVLVRALTKAGGSPTVTIGNDKNTAEALEKMGGRHEAQPKGGLTLDGVNQIVSTPAYMYGDSRISEVAAGIEKTIAELLKMIE